jgi:hypothetical protein
MLGYYLSFCLFVVAGDFRSKYSAYQGLIASIPFFSSEFVGKRITSTPSRCQGMRSPGNKPQSRDSHNF